MPPTHLVLASAGLALLLGVGTAAGSGFTCGDGEEVYYDKLCNGVDDCTEGSDEAASLCDTTYPGNFTVGDKLVARVQFEWALHAINFDLCNNSNCSRLYVFGSSSSRRLAYFGSVGCNRHGGFCSKMYNSGYGGQGHFLTGEQVFGLERRADGLSVWQHGHPGDNIWIPAPLDYDRLRITPDTWYHDMPVALSRDVGSCNEQEFQCSDGQCVSLLYKCDGVADCADGADEDAAACALASVNLTVDSLAVARVQYRAEHGALIFLLCGDTGCNHLRRARCGSQGGFWGGYRMDDCSLQGSFCNGGAGSSCFPEESFPPGELVFEIQLKEAWPSGDFQSVEIRLRGESRFSGGDTVKKGNTRLQIRPANWTSAMPVNYTAIPLTTTAAPTTTTTLPTTTTTTPATAPPTDADPPTTATPRRTTTAAPWRTTPASRSTPSSPTTRSPPPAWPPQPAPLVCEPRFAYLLLPAAGDCRGYTVCLAGSGRLARCDAPLLFSYALQACVWPGTPAAEPCAA